LLRIADPYLHAVGAHGTGVANLATGLGVERRLVENDAPALAGLELGYFLAVLDQRLHHAFGALSLVAEELGGAEFFAQTKPYGLGRGIARALPGLARLFLLLLHRRRESRGVDADLARAQGVLRQVE